MRRQLALFCTMVLVWPSAAGAFGAPQAAATQMPSLKEQFTQMPSGSVVEVKMTDRQKIRGRLGSINDSGFEVQHTRNGQIVTETLAYENVKSAKLIGQGWSPEEDCRGNSHRRWGTMVIGLIGAAATGGFSQ